MKSVNSFIISPDQEHALKASVKALKVKFEISKEKPFDPEFVAKIKVSPQQVKEGKITTVEKENLKAFLSW